MPSLVDAIGAGGEVGMRTGSPKALYILHFDAAKIYMRRHLTASWCSSDGLMLYWLNFMTGRKVASGQQVTMFDGNE
jgi:hypothetical protein